MMKLMMHHYIVQNLSRASGLLSHGELMAKPVQ